MFHILKISLCFELADYILICTINFRAAFSLQNICKNKKHRKMCLNQLLVLQDENSGKADIDK